MISGTVLTQRVVLLGALAVMTGQAAAQTPSPALVITGSGKSASDSVLQIIDPVAKKVVARVPLSGHPHQVAVSTDGKWAFVTEIAAGSQWLNYPTPEPDKNSEPLPEDTISVIDLTTQKEVRLVDVGPGSEPHDITFVRGKVYFTAEGYKEVGRYDPAANRIDWRAGVGQNRVHQIVLTKDATKLFTANIGSDTVAALLPWDKSVDVQPYSEGHAPPPWNGTLITVGKGPEGIAMSPDEKEVWVLTRGNAGMSIIDTSARKVLQTVDLKTKDPLRITFTPDGSRVLISDAKTGDILVLDCATRTEIKRIPGAGPQVHAIVMAPDGSFAYTVSETDNNIAIIDLKKLEIVDRIPVGTGADGMAWVSRK
jgi:YVTN family beta-propeller protein